MTFFPKKMAFVARHEGLLYRVGEISFPISPLFTGLVVGQSFLYILRNKLPRGLACLKLMSWMQAFRESYNQCCVLDGSFRIERVIPL
jgi:hypothetical protein